jgi:hypothetical protein
MFKNMNERIIVQKSMCENNLLQSIKEWSMFLFEMWMASNLILFIYL